MTKFNEDTKVKIPAILHLCRLGYEYVSLKNAVWDTDTNIFTDIFKKAITKINSDFDEDQAERLFQDISIVLDNEDLGKAFFEKLTSQTGTKLIDFENFENNTFNVVTELTYKNGDEEFRPEIILLINGMPLAFIEVKKPNNRDGIIAERERINKRFQNKKFRKFVNITQLMMFSNNMEYDNEDIEPLQGAFYASPSYFKPIFNYFREEETLNTSELLADENDDLENIILKDNNLAVIKNSPEFLTNKNPKTPTNRVSTSLFSKDRLAFILKYAIAYVDEKNGIEKHIMRYPQIFATKAIENKLVGVSFEHIFSQKFDFYASIFEYLIKDYNTNSGGKYAEYFTPHAVAKIMAAILVNQPTQDVTVYDPSAGSGTLLMNIAHAIGEDKCTIYSQDISQKSSGLLRLNLILNNLVHSISNIIQGNTISHPYHKDENGQPAKFDFIVSNPPFKLDFSDFRDDLDSKENHDRFFAGIPNVPKAAKDKMAIYLLFVQHIMYSLSKKGKAAVVVPTGFITAQSGIDKAIRERLVESKMLAGVVSMPSNIFATTGTNVSIVFMDKNNKEDVVLIDASNLGETVKEGKNQKTGLTATEEQKIIDTFNNKQAVDDFSVVVKYDEIKEKNYSLSAGQYFEVKIEYVDITHDEFTAKMKGFEDNLSSLFAESKTLETEIMKNLEGVGFDKLSHQKI
jgi:type I restriction enzyme M protein